MKKHAVSLIVLLGLLWLPLMAGAADKQVLNGNYQWDQGGASGDLEATFKPTGEGTWDVAFRFTFQGRSHTYEGTAEGSLTEGALKGKVRNENKRRTFTFEGKFEAGKFSGIHAEISGNREYRTGTLTLKV